MKLGWKGKLYYGTAGTTPTPSESNEVDECKNVTANINKGEVDATLRKHGGYQSYIGGLRLTSFEFSIPTDKASTQYQLFRDAFLNDTVISILGLDEEGGEGPDMDVEVFDFSRDEPIDDIMMTKIKLLPSARASRKPDWHGVTT